MEADIHKTLNEIAKRAENAFWEVVQKELSEDLEHLKLDNSEVIIPSEFAGECRKAVAEFWMENITSM